MTIKLSSFLGTLLVEIARARVNADLESVEIAEMYSSHPLLKHMPVPRFKLPEVNIDISVAVDDLDNTAKKEKQPITGLRSYTMPTSDEANDILNQGLKYADLAFKEKQINQLKTAFMKDITRLKKSPKNILSTNRIVTELLSSLSKPLDEFLPEKSKETLIQRKKFNNAVKSGLQQLFINQIEKFDHINIRPKAKDLQTVTDNWQTMNLRMTVTEEAYEFSLGEDELGESVENFTPE